MPDIAAAERASLAPVDWGLLFIYFVGVAVAGLICFQWEQRAAGAAGSSGQGGQDQFFLAGRSMGWLPIGLSLFVSNIGSEHLLGLSGSAAADGLAVGIYELTASLDVLVLGWVFAPIYLRSGIATLPEYLERRYSRELRSAFSVVTLLIYVLTKLSVSVFSGATILASLFGWPRFASAAGLVVLTAFYTALGGLSAVIMTDMAQAVVLIAGTVCMTAIALSETGGFVRLRASPPADVSAEAWERFFHLYRPPDHPHLPTLGIVLGQSVAGLWYFCLDQSIVQRVLAARSIDDARGATLLCGFLKTLPMFIMALPGVAARKLYSLDLAADTNQALPLMMARLLPPGMLGLMLAAALAACMSSLDSVFTAAASLVCLDLFKPYVRPTATQHEMVLVGRLSCAALAVLTLLWMPVIDLLSDQIFVYIQSISSYLAPPVVAVYFGGVLWRGATVKGATAAFVVGYALGVGRILGEIVIKTGGAGATRSVAVEILFETNYLYIGFFIFVASTSALVLVSLLTPPPAADQLAGLTVEWRNPFPGLFLAVADCAREPSPAMRSFELTEVGASEAGGPRGVESAWPKATPGATSELRTAEAPRTQAAQGAQGPAHTARTSAHRPPQAHATRTLPRRRRGDRFHALNVILSSVLIVLSAALVADWW